MSELEKLITDKPSFDVTMMLDESGEDARKVLEIFASTKAQLLEKHAGNSDSEPELNVVLAGLDASSKILTQVWERNYPGKNLTN